MKYIHKFRIRFGDTDAYGIVHHSSYYNYFEEARFQFSADLLGFNVGSEVKFPIIESSCIYKNPLKFSLDYFLVELEFRIVDDSKLEFIYTIKDENQKTRYAYGKTVHVFVNEQNKLCVEIPEWFKNKVGLLNNEQ